MDGVGIGQHLAERWLPARQSVLEPLVTHVLSLTPCAVVCHNERAWLQVGEVRECEFEGFFIPPPPTIESVGAVFAKFDFNSDVRCEIELLLMSFSGLRENAPGNSSGEFSEPPWSLYTLSEVIDYPGLDFGAFHSAFPLFYDGSGNVLLVNPDGRTAWWLCEEGRMEEFTNIIEDLLEFYVRFRESSPEERGWDSLFFGPYIAFE